LGITVRRTIFSIRTPCRTRKLLCATARMLCVSDAIRPSDKAVIEDRTTHFIASTVVTKHGNAPLGGTSEREEKRREEKRRDNGSDSMG